MKKYVLITLICAAMAFPAFAQESENDSTIINSDSLLNAGLDQLMSYMLFTRDDFTFRDDYMPKDPYRLKIVDSLMKHPLLMDDFADSCAALLEKFPHSNYETIKLIHSLIGPPSFGCEFESKMTGCYFFDHQLHLFKNIPGLDYAFQSIGWILGNGHLAILKQIEIDYNCYDNMADSHTVYGNANYRIPDSLRNDKLYFVVDKYKELILDYPDYREYSNEELDSLQQIEEEWTKEFTEKFQTPINPSYHYFNKYIFNAIDSLESLLLTDSVLVKKMDQRWRNEVFGPFQTGLGQIAIGSYGNDIYTGDYFMIIDPGGDDVYNISYDIENPHPTLIVDFSGNDIYKAETDFALASGALSYSLLIDYEGDDVYWGKNFSLGSGYFGVGILWDKKGNDKYFGDTFVQGAGTFGLGLLIDEDGSDTYTCHFQSQGFGFVRGIGGIADYAGNDIYNVQPKYKEFYHSGDHYQSLSQGFGIGVRPYMSGGFGFICDYGGNDSYIADFFAQGSSYWWSLGMIYDKSGNDLYASYQYAQGAGAHMSLGLLLDGGGDDIYRSNGVCQGCGHDYSCGWLLDRGGNDVYSAHDLAHGAGQANGIGIFTDLNGDDGYYTTKAHNTQGYGNPRRDYGSIGLFLDMAGDDRYGGNGDNGRFWKVPGKWGGGLDLKKVEVIPSDSAEVKN